MVDNIPLTTRHPLSIHEELQALEYRINCKIYTPYPSAAWILLHINGKLTVGKNKIIYFVVHFHSNRPSLSRQGLLRLQQIHISNMNLIVSIMNLQFYLQYGFSIILTRLFARFMLFNIAATVILFKISWLKGKNNFERDIHCDQSNDLFYNYVIYWYM